MNHWQLSLKTLYLFALSLPIEGLMVGGIGITKIISIALLGVYILTVREFKLIKSKLLFIALAYLFYSFISLGWSFDSDSGTETVQTYILIFIIGFVLLQLITSMTIITKFFRCFALGSCIAALNIVYNYLNDIPYRGLEYLSDVEAVRYSAFDVDPNETCLLLTIATSFMLYQLIIEKRVILKALLAFAIILCTYSILLTASRTGFVLMVISTSLVLLQIGIKLRTLVLLILFIFGNLFLLIYFQWIPIMTIERIASAASGIMLGNFNNRENVWETVIEIFSHHPFIGVGIGGLDEAMKIDGFEVMASHNTYLGILAQLGIIGFALFIYMLYLAINQMRRLPSEPRWLLILFIILLVGIFTLVYDQRKLTWIFILFAALIDHWRKLEQYDSIKPINLAFKFGENLTYNS